MKIYEKIIQLSQRHASAPFLFGRDLKLEQDIEKLRRAVFKGMEDYIDDVGAELEWDFPNQTVMEDDCVAFNFRIQGRDEEGAVRISPVFKPASYRLEVWIRDNGIWRDESDSEDADWYRTVWGEALDMKYE